MKRSTPASYGLMPLGIAALLWSVSTGLAIAQQSSERNPLRPAGKAVARATPPAAIGTAVRSSEKRTPDITAHQDHSVLTERPRSKSSGVSAAAYRRRVSRPPMSLSPTHEQHIGTSVLNGTVTVQPQPSDAIDGGLIYEQGSESEMGNLESVDDCGGCDGNGCNQCCLMSCPKIRWDDLTVFGGVQGFTGPKNLGQSGSFGFHEGLNWGSPVPCSDGCLGIQLGARFTQSNLSGAEFTPDTRHQTFLTGGAFRRVDCGLQYGVAFDYLLDDWYTNTDLTQLRGELSWVFPCAHELGFWMTASLNKDTAATQIFTNQVPANGTATWEATDLYAFFYRHRFNGWEGGSCRMYAGFTGASDGFIGTDFQVPLSCDLALQAGFAYLVPDQAKGPAAAGNEQESWNVAISLVWYPGCATATGKSYFSPLFNVADNGSFMVDRLQ